MRLLFRATDRVPEARDHPNGALPDRAGLTRSGADTNVAPHTEHVVRTPHPRIGRPHKEG
jgi:hypothetical protein